MNHYLHNNKLFEIDRMPPDNWLHPEGHEWTRFHAYLSTLQPIPHELKGEGIVVEGKDFEWRYEVIGGKGGWQQCGHVMYDPMYSTYRRRVAVPIEAKKEKCGVCGKEGGGHYINCTEHFRGGRSQPLAPKQQPAKETMLEQLADLLKKHDARKYLNLNDSGYSQVERDIVDLFASQQPQQQAGMEAVDVDAQAHEFAEGMMGLGKYDGKKWHHADAMTYNLIIKSVKHGAKLVQPAAPPSVSNPVAKELKQIRDAFQWTFDNMGTPHTSDHFNVPANAIEQLDNLIALFTSQHGEQEPKKICYCGSLRVAKEAFQKAEYESVLSGDIALLPCCMFVDIQREYGAESDYKQKADDLHKRKIDICDEVFVLNVDGYIGESTRSEIEYATKIGKPVKYLEPVDSTQTPKP